MSDARETDPSISTYEALANAAQALAESARYQLALFSDTLDPRAYGDASLCDALRQLALRSSRSQIRILVRHTDRVLVGVDHPIVTLARRLPSRIEIRQADALAQANPAEWMIADSVGLLRRKQADKPQAFLRMTEPGAARRVLQDFDRHWARSDPATALRQLSI